MVEMLDDPAVTYSAPRGCGAADCWLTMVGGGVWNTGHERMSTSVCTEERTSAIGIILVFVFFLQFEPVTYDMI